MIGAFEQEQYNIDKTAHEANIRNVVVSTFSFLLLKLDGDATYWSLLDPLHQMCHKTSTTGTTKWEKSEEEEQDVSSSTLCRHFSTSLHTIHLGLQP